MHLSAHLNYLVFISGTCNHLTLILSLTLWRLQLLRGQKKSDDCSCFPTSTVAFCGFISKCFSSSEGPVKSKSTSRLNLARLETTRLKVDCSEIPTYKTESIQEQRWLSCFKFFFSLVVKVCWPFQNPQCLGGWIWSLWGFHPDLQLEQKCSSRNSRPWQTVLEALTSCSPSEPTWSSHSPLVKVWRTLIVATCTKECTAIIYNVLKGGTTWKLICRMRVYRFSCVLSIINLSLGDTVPPMGCTLRLDCWSSQMRDGCSTEKWKGSSSPFTRSTVCCTLRPTVCTHTRTHTLYCFLNIPYAIYFNLFKIKMEAWKCLKISFTCSSNFSHYKVRANKVKVAYSSMFMSFVRIMTHMLCTVQYE